MKKLLLVLTVLFVFAASALYAAEVRGKITEVSGNKITFNLGKKDGVVKDSKGRILHLITNQLTGKSVEVNIGKFTVTEVGESQSAGSVDELAPGWQVGTKNLVVLEANAPAPATQTTQPAPPEETPPAPSTPEETPPAPSENPSQTPPEPEQTTAPAAAPTFPEGVPQPTELLLSPGDLKGAPGGSGALCSLKITAAPVEASVYIDHTLKGETPLTINLAPGKHLVRVVKAPDYAPYLQTIELTADQTWELAVNQVPSTDAYLEKGKEAYQNGDFQAASQNLFQAIQYLPFQEDALFYLGLVYTKAGQLDEAVRMFRAFAFYQPNSFEMRYNLGNIYAAKKDFNHALTSYKLAVLSIPQYQNVLDNPPTDASSGNVYRYLNMTAREPNNMTYRIILAYLYELRGEPQKGIEQLKVVMHKYLNR